MIERPFGTKLCFRCFWGERQSLGKNIKEKRKTKTNQTWVWVQTSKNLQTGQSYMYISHYNLKQKRIITLKYVLSEFKERRDFHGVGIREATWEQWFLRRPWRTARHRDGRKGIWSKGRIMRKVAEMQTWNTYTKRGFTTLVRCQLETIHCRWFLQRHLTARTMYRDWAEL